MRDAVLNPINSRVRARELMGPSLRSSDAASIEASRPRRAGEQHAVVGLTGGHDVAAVRRPRVNLIFEPPQSPRAPVAWGFVGEVQPLPATKGMAASRPRRNGRTPCSPERC
jgi:hypothetical protein